jgi:hypothetical protein
VADLNKTLPEGVRVAKSWLGEEYKVVNKIDGYEFKAPKAWRGIEEIEYVPERTENSYTASNISGSGREGHSRVFTIARFKISGKDIDLKPWAENNFKAFGLTGNFYEEKLGEFKIIKATEEKYLAGMYVYFFYDSQTIFAITNGSEEFIREIILSGQW